MITRSLRQCSLQGHKYFANFIQQINDYDKSIINNSVIFELEKIIVLNSLLKFQCHARI